MSNIKLDELEKMAKETAAFGVHPSGEYIYSFYTEQLQAFAKLIEDRVYSKQLELPEPRLTGKFSITMGKFKCTGCTGLWDSSEQAKNHSCKDYQ
jgi:hypothetical protein